MKKRVLLYVLHLLGVGHLRRADVLARAMQAGGLDVTIALGSQRVAQVPFDGLKVVQLPPAAIKDLNFSDLLDPAGNPVDDAWREARRKALFATYQEVDPDVLIFELFPFGRRQFRFELLPLLDMVHAAERRPHVVSSVRDVLVASPKPGRHAESAELARRYFDLVLVHSDPTLIPFEATFTEAASIADLIHYTGYVTTAAGTTTTAETRGEVVVSAGGGAVGAPLLFAALAARPNTPLAGRTWRFLTGPHMPEGDFQRLAAMADDRTIVERFRPDFPALVEASTLSISQAGYNTTMDILRANARAVLIPYENKDETEQRLRSDLLAAKGLLTVVPLAELTPDRLAEAVAATMAKPRPQLAGVNLAGAEDTVKVIGRLAAARLDRR
jgi:predicted glycosyltransferase